MLAWLALALAALLVWSVHRALSKAVLETLSAPQFYLLSAVVSLPLYLPSLVFDPPPLRGVRRCPGSVRDDGDQGIADPERTAIGGWSWGGYVTLLALGLHPDRWMCGIAGVPVGDYAASYDDSAPSLQAYDRSLLGGTVYDVPDLVRERSPMTYAVR